MTAIALYISSFFLVMIATEVIAGVFNLREDQISLGGFILIIILLAIYFFF